MHVSNRTRQLLDALVAEIALCMPARWRDANFSIIYAGDRMTCALQDREGKSRARPSPYLITLTDELRRRMELAGEGWDSAWFELSMVGDSITYWSDFERSKPSRSDGIPQFCSP